jgi:hypothetical protein
MNFKGIVRRPPPHPPPHCGGGVWQGNQLPPPTHLTTYTRLSDSKVRTFTIKLVPLVYIYFHIIFVSHGGGGGTKRFLLSNKKILFPVLDPAISTANGLLKKPLAWSEKTSYFLGEI